MGVFVVALHGGHGDAGLFQTAQPLHGLDQRGRVDGPFLKEVAAQDDEIHPLGDGLVDDVQKGAAKIVEAFLVVVLLVAQVNVGEVQKFTFHLTRYPQACADTSARWPLRAPRAPGRRPSHTDRPGSWPWPCRYMSSQVDDRSGFTAQDLGTGRVTCMTAVANGEYRRDRAAGRPGCNTSVTPRAYTSLRPSSRSLRTCSGLDVLRRSSTNMAPVMPLERFNDLARPKSDRKASPEALKRMLDGLTSRWIRDLPV